MTTYILSAEEYLLSLLLTDQTAAAVAIQEEAFPEASEEEMDVRFDSGLNGLLSKRLIDIKGDDHELDADFKAYLTGISEASRAIKFQVADGSHMKTVSLFLGNQMDVQVMEYNARVHSFFPIEDLSVIHNMVDFLDHDEETGFTIPERQFDPFISQFFSDGNSSEVQKLSGKVPGAFVDAVVKKQGRLNSIFDFKFDSNGNMQNMESYLYITGHDKTWFIEQDDQILTVRVKPLNQILKF